MVTTRILELGACSWGKLEDRTNTNEKTEEVVKIWTWKYDVFNVQKMMILVCDGENAVPKVCLLKGSDGAPSTLTRGLSHI